jgi:hypothetical protein
MSLNSRTEWIELTLAISNSTNLSQTQQNPAQFQQKPPHPPPAITYPPQKSH